MPTFPNISIDANSGYERTPRNLRAPFGDGYSQIIGDGVNNYSEIWSLSFTNRPKSDIATIKSFLDNNNGQASFDWQAPDDAASKKWIWTGKYKITDAEADTRSISFTIERWFGS